MRAGPARCATCSKCKLLGTAALGLSKRMAPACPKHWLIQVIRIAYARTMDTQSTTFQKFQYDFLSAASKEFMCFVASDPEDPIQDTKLSLKEMSLLQKHATPTCNTTLQAAKNPCLPNPPVIFPECRNGFPALQRFKMRLQLSVNHRR